MVNRPELQTKGRKKGASRVIKVNKRIEAEFRATRKQMSAELHFAIYGMHAEETK